MKPPTETSDHFPRMFPAWLRRIDPTLAAEDTNTLYQVYLNRRVTKSWAMRIGLKLHGIVLGAIDMLALLVTGVFIVAGMILLALAMFRWGRSGLATLFSLALFPFAIWGIIRLFSWRMRAVRVGRTVMSLVIAPKQHRQVITDLYLCGVSGDDIAEAISLEWRERVPVIALFVYTLVFSTTVLPTLGWMPKALVHLILLGGWIAFITAPMTSFVIRMPLSAAERLRTYRTQLIILGSTPGTITTILTGGRLRGADILSAFIAVMAFVAFLTGVIQDLRLSIPIHLPPGFYLALAAHFLYAGALLHPILSWRSRHRDQEALTRAVTEFGASYDAFVMREILGEKDFM